MTKALPVLAAAMAALFVLGGCSADEPVASPEVDSTPAPAGATAASDEAPLSIEQFREGQRSSFAQRDPDRDDVVELTVLAPRYRKQFKRMDANDDQRVTRAELEQSVTDRFTAADKNGDNMLQPEEWR